MAINFKLPEWQKYKVVSKLLYPYFTFKIVKKRIWLRKPYLEWVWDITSNINMVESEVTITTVQGVVSWMSSW